MPGKRKKIVVAVKSKKTDIIHIFGDIKAFEKQISAFKQEHKYKTLPEITNGLSFWNWIQKQNLSLVTPSITWNKPVYRLVYGGFSPLSIVGSISDGGRFNIGAAQMRSEFPSVKKAGSLYAASSLKCSYSETSSPIGKPEEYKLEPRRNLKLWDLTNVIQKLNHADLDAFVKASPVAAIWGYQKVPMISQLLAHALRQIGGDGLIYPSIKDPTAQNLAFFMKSDAECVDTFIATKLN